jgi:outer membrane assembly lipoprotein YfgL
VTAFFQQKIFRTGLLSGLVCLLVACAATPDKPKPVELQPNAALIGVRLAWSSRVGGITFPLSIQVYDNRIFLAGTDGTVAEIDATTGKDVWRTSAGEQLAAGVGSDGKVAAVVTRSNVLIVFGEGKELWRQKIPAQVYTSPLVAGARVFVLAADRSVTAFDALGGHKLWTQQRPGESLVLQQSGVLLAVGDTLVVGLSGRMVGLNPLNGGARWEIPLATSRGTNDVERLVDLVGPASRVGRTVCARSFQVSVGCVDAVRGVLLWTQPASGFTGMQGDAKFVFGTESDGKVTGWSRSNGDRLWVSDQLRFRGLTTPLVAGRSLVVGDSTGMLHLLSVENGAFLNRMTTDGSAIAAPPVLAGNTLVAVTRNGGVFGFLPE